MKKKWSQFNAWFKHDFLLTIAKDDKQIARKLIVPVWIFIIAMLLACFVTTAMPFGVTSTTQLLVSQVTVIIMIIAFLRCNSLMRKAQRNAKNKSNT